MRTLLLAAVVLVGCSSSHGDGEVDGGRPGRDTGPAPERDAAVALPPPGRAVCGGAVCAEGHECCAATGTCFDPADASACTVPPEKTMMDPRACASNRDCAEGEICESSDIFMHDDGPRVCTGVIGVCVMARTPVKCGGFGDGVCGCDGRTYRDPCEASRAGVRVLHWVPCGRPIGGDGLPRGCSRESPDCRESEHCDFDRGLCVLNDPIVACGIDEQCPTGHSCCSITGVCVRDSCVSCCAVPPPGSTIGCDIDADCYGATPTPGELYCGGLGCGPGGGCVRPTGSCTGVLDPVCGCDGMTYTNACYAEMAGVRIEHPGMCE